MVVLRFNDESVRRDCCDLAHMRRRWGAERARQLSHRLQQLDAMTALTDLDFLPFESRTASGRIEVDVDDALVLVLDPAKPKAPDNLMATVVVHSVMLRSAKGAR